MRGHRNLSCFVVSACVCGGLSTVTFVCVYVYNYMCLLADADSHVYFCGFLLTWIQKMLYLAQCVGSQDVDF